jgi:hypothetical protein
MTSEESAITVVAPEDNTCTSVVRVKTATGHVKAMLKVAAMLPPTVGIDILVGDKVVMNNWRSSPGLNVGFPASVKDVRFVRTAVSVHALYTMTITMDTTELPDGSHELKFPSNFTWSASDLVFSKTPDMMLDVYGTPQLFRRVAQPACNHRYFYETAQTGLQVTFPGRSHVQICWASYAITEVAGTVVDFSPAAMPPVSFRVTSE